MPDERYRPSCGTEGADFMDRWCVACAKDDMLRGGESAKCQILSDTMLYEVDDPRYPAEWVRDAESGRTRCTAFVALKEAANG